MKWKIKKKNTNLPGPISIRDAFSKNYVDKLFNDPSVLKKDTDIDLSDVKSEKIKFCQINYQPNVSSHLTPKMYNIGWWYWSKLW